MNLKTAFLLLILLSISLLVSNSVTEAQVDIGEGIDLIILVDQSGSMTVGEDNIAPTDPEGLRLDAARYLIEYMAFDNNSVNPDRVNRVTVVGFAGWADVLVYPTTLDSAENMKNAQAQIRQQNLGGGTNFLAGLEMIREDIFPPATDVELENDHRRRIIVIITDGSPFYAEAEESSFTQEQYFTEIEDYYLQQFGREKYPLYIVGIDQFNYYWKSVERFWNAIASPSPLDPTMNRAFRAVNSEEITTEIISFLCPFLGQTGTDRDCRVVELGEHYVEPYAHTVRFSFFKNQQDSQIELSRPMSQGGAVVMEGDPDVTFIPHNIRTESYEIRFPEPGCWTTTKRGEGRVDVLTDTSFKNFLELNTPVDLHPQIVPLKLVFDVKDENGLPIAEKSGYPVRFEASLTDPNGNVQRVEVAKENGTDCVYISTNNLSTEILGEYRVEIKGFVDINAADFSCLEEGEGGARQLFDKQFVFDVFRPNIQVHYPEQAHFLYAPLDKIILESVDENGNFIFLSETQPWVFETSLETPSGEVIPVGSPKWVNGFYEIPGPLFLNETGFYKVVLVAQIDGRTFYERETVLETAENIALLAPRTQWPILTPILTTTIQLQNSDGQPAIDNPSFPLQLEASLFDNEENQITAALEMVTGTIPGQYQVVTPWMLEESGSYTIEVKGYVISQDTPDQPKKLAFLREFLLSGSSDLPRIEVVSPAQINSAEQNLHALHGGWSEWFRSTPMRIEVQLFKGLSPTRSNDVFQGDMTGLVTVTIEDEEGNMVLEDLPLAESENGSIGLFGIELFDLTEVGNYVLRVQLNGEKLNDGRDYKGVVPDIVVPFQLIETNLYRTVRVTAIIILSVLSALALAFLGWIIWGFLPPYPRGVLVAQPIGFGPRDPLSEFRLNGKGLKRKTVIFKGKDTKSLNLKMIKVSRSSPIKSGAAKKLSLSPDGKPVQTEVVEIKAIGQDKGKGASGRLSGNRSVKCTQKTIDPQSGNVTLDYEFIYRQ